MKLRPVFLLCTLWMLGAATAGAAAADALP